MFKDFVKFVRDLYGTKGHIPLHAPQFIGDEKDYVLDTISSTYVSSIGKYVDQFEDNISQYTGVKHAVATVNGTAALHMALKLSGVENDTEVLTQSLSFVATTNSIKYCGAFPVFLDVSTETLGLSSKKLGEFLDEFSEMREDGFCWNKVSERKISACLPMHTFGFPVEIEEIKEICSQHNIKLVEDAAESLGSFYKGKHTGSYGDFSAISFNGNKIITTGGGGMILTNDSELASKAKHITTTARTGNNLFFIHDQIGFNYRMPNINAALGLAQLESLPRFLESKLEIANRYREWGRQNNLEFFDSPAETKPNYWLNAFITQDITQRDEMLEVTNDSNVSTRPVWTPMHKLEIFKDCQKDDLKNTNWLADRLVNVPSSFTSNIEKI